MKNIFSITTVLFFIVSSAFAAPFAPEPMTITGQDVLQYDFDGNELSIPVTIAVKPSNTLLYVFTKDNASNIPAIRNGHMGWHWINKIDTCIFMSETKILAPGSHTLTWDGKDQDGGMVPAGEYTYYIWGYDNQSFKELAVDLETEGIRHSRDDRYNQNRIEVLDLEGNVLPQPIINFEPTNVSIESWGEGYTRRFKWYLGNEPTDETKLESTTYVKIGYENCGYTQDPYNADGFFVINKDSENIQHVRKLKWIPNGEATLETSWGEGGAYVYAGLGHNRQGVDYVGEDILVSTLTHTTGKVAASELVLIDVTDGTGIRNIDLAEVWVNVEEGQHELGWDVSGPWFINSSYRQNRTNLLVLGSHVTCLTTVANVHDEESFGWNVWTNTNGDYVGDRNYEEGSAAPWICTGPDSPVFMYYKSFNKNHFVATTVWGYGDISFALFAPDGTGKNLSYAGENAGMKNYFEFIDVDGPYDGIICDNKSAGTQEAGWVWGYWWIGNDSFKGVITSKPTSAEEEGPAVFDVAQNSPNPANPITTISFSLAEAGNVSVDIYNVAGQKIDTLVNEFMDSGTHSIVWNGSDFSSGVYFYTVKAGDFSKTMKMTLLK